VFGALPGDGADIDIDGSELEAPAVPPETTSEMESVMHI